MRTDTVNSVILTAIGIGLLALAGRQNYQLVSSVEARDTAHTVAAPFERAPLPPVVAFTTIALGGFRGIAADLLWLRAAVLQDEGRYFELVQLAEWITTLEPQFTDVWALQAWNMAYNISVMLPGERDRWRWVLNGIHLLRDRGLRYTPTDPDLYHELGMLFLHKIGTDTDPSSAYYKRQWAKQMMDLLGESGFPDFDALKNNSEAADKLKAKGLNLQRMQEIDEQYGPLDWRVAETHALYWAYLGRSVAGADGASTACERMIYQSMAALFDHGQLTYSAEGDLFVSSPNFDLLPNVQKTFEHAMALAKNELPAQGYAAFLASASLTLKFYGREIEARAYFDTLHRRFPSRATRQGFAAFSQGEAATMPRFFTAQEGVSE
jgi:hypothetical protein